MIELNISTKNTTQGNETSSNEQIIALKRNDIKNIELRRVYGKNIADLNSSEAVELRNLLDDNEICARSIGSPIGKVKLDDNFNAHLDLFKALLQTTQILGSKMIRMFSFYPPENTSAEDCKELVFERIEALLELSEAAGIKCYHENEKGIFGDTSKRCLDLLSAFNGRLGGIFDPANYIQCGEKPSVIYDELEKYTDYFHIKDALLETGRVVPPGEGDGAIAEILTKYSKSSKFSDTLLTVEPHLKAFVGCETLGDEKSFAKNYSYASNDDAFDAAINALKGILERIGADYE